MRSRSTTRGCPVHGGGLPSHLAPFGNADGVIAPDRDQYFDREHLGFGVGSKLIAYLARTGISEQTGSKPGKTIVQGCVAGWGQGPLSSQVFQPDGKVDLEQLELLTRRLQAISRELGHGGAITAGVLGVHVSSQVLQPYSTAQGTRTVSGCQETLAAYFRAHIQWQSLVELCGYVGTSGVKQITPRLLHLFYTSQEAFFANVVHRRQQLRAGTWKPGAEVPLVPWDSDISPVASDRELRRTKSVPRVLARIAWHMARRQQTTLGPLLPRTSRTT